MPQVELNELFSVMEPVTLANLKYDCYDIKVTFYYNKEVNVITIQIYDRDTEINTTNYLKFSVDSVVTTVRRTLASLFDREIRINQQKYNSIRKDRICKY